MFVVLLSYGSKPHGVGKWIRHARPTTSESVWNSHGQIPTLLQGSPPRTGPHRAVMSFVSRRSPSGTPDELIASTGSPLRTLLRSRPLKTTPGQRMAVPEVPGVNRSTESHANRQQAISTRVVACRSIQGDPGSECSGIAHEGTRLTRTTESRNLELSRGPRRAPKRTG